MGWFSFLRGIIKNCSHQVPQQIKVDNKLYNFHAAETRYEKNGKDYKMVYTYKHENSEIQFQLTKEKINRIISMCIEHNRKMLNKI